MAWSISYTPPVPINSGIQPLSGALALAGISPTVSASGGTQGTLVITPAAADVPQPAVGVPFEVPFTSTGTGPWVWVKNSGAAWFSIDPSTGIGSGTPTTPESDPISIGVTDSLGATGTLNF